MLIRRLTVQNFGPFRGTHSLDLEPCHTPSSRRPIILIGGRNGSGKTSLLEAIRLCLHGRRSIGPRAADYQQYLRDRLHQSSSGQRARTASVCLEIEHVEAGVRHVYELARCWFEVKGMVREELHVTRDGQQVTELYPEQYQSFLDELVPFGVSEFFFFDGERIQRLADENGSDSVMADSIRGLLGLDVIERLHADLSILLRTCDGSQATSQWRSQLAQLERRLVELKEKVATLEAEVQGATETVEQLERQVALQEQRVASEGGDFARRRESLIKERSHWQAVLQACEAELREMTGGLLPFCLIPELCTRLRERVVFESRRQREDITREALKAAAATLTEELRSESFWEHELGTQPVPSLVEKFTHSVIRLINKMLPEPRQEESGVHDLSERDRNALLNAIEKILTDVPQRAISLSSKCEEAHQHLRRIEQDLQKVPREEALRPLLWELNRLQKELGQARASLEARQHQLKAAYAEREEIERKLSQLDEQLQNAAASSRAMALTTKVLGVLKLYRQALSVARVDLLGQCVTECYQALVHKRSLCSRIAFDPHTLTASLHNTTGQLVYKERLSAGEKQVLAIAILWGLGRASGRQLPVVIDAPLARLDIEHRATLLSNYFPNASHQVIVLSTDSEIDHHGFEMLKPWVAKAYRLRFDEGTGCSLVEHGYW